jgi:hypothetical protein
MPYPRTILLPINTQDGTAYTGSTSLGDLTPLPFPKIPADILQPSGVIMINVIGRFTSSGTPGTVTTGLYLGKSGVAIGSATNICISGSLTVPASLTNKAWWAHYEVEVLSPGAGTGAGFGQLRGAGRVTGITTGGVVDLIPNTAPFAAVNLDTTADEYIHIGLTPSVTTGSWQVHNVLAEYTGN